MEQNEDKKGIWISELNEWIEDDYEYSEIVAEVIDAYCNDLAKEEGMTIPVDEWEDAVNESWDYVWTRKAQKLIEETISYWQLIGNKYWPEGDIDIQQHLTQYKEL